MIITEHNEHSGNASLDDGFVLLFRSPHGQEIRKQRPKVMTFPERIESFKMSINKLNFPGLVCRDSSVVERSIAARMVTCSTHVRD